MWSSQSYKKLGLESGHSEKLIDDAIEQSELTIHSANCVPPILSLNHLAKRTGVEYEWLRGYVMRNHMDGGGSIDAYQKFSIRKRSGGRRFIHVPTPKLMHTQRWINEHILKELPVHHASHAFRKGNSIQKCAVRHCGAQWLIKIDIADFFESVSEIEVFRVFNALGYQPLVAFELARLCTVGVYWKSPRGKLPQWRTRNPNHKITTYYQELLGYLPQGAPTSPLLANLVMINCDAELQELARKTGLTYTRYSDDMSFSTGNKSFGRLQARNFVYEAYKVLSKSGFRPRLRKTTIVPPGGKKVILGLNVDGEVPKLSKKIKDRIRQHLYYLEKFGPVEHAMDRKFDSVWGMKAHLRGMIDFAHMIDEDFAQMSLEKFKKIDWPV